MRVTIYENEGFFDVHNEDSKLVRGGFASESEAVYFCKKNNYEIVDVYFMVV